MSRTHGYAPKGQRVESVEPLQPPVKQTVIAGLSTRGILAPLIVEGAMNGALFVAWLEQELFPQMKSGDLLILDNLRVHKVEEVAAAAAKAQIELIYLPPYSPDLSAIEPMWSKVKAILRKIGATTKEELEKAFCQALDAVTSENILNWFHHCGYTCDT